MTGATRFAAAALTATLLTVTGSTATVGAAVWSAPAPAPVEPLIELGQEVSGTMSSEAPHTFLIDLEAGALIDLAAVSPDRALELYIELWTEDGEHIIGWNWYYGHVPWQAVLHSITVPTTTRYRIFLYGWGTGEYVLRPRTAGPVVALSPADGWLVLYPSNDGTPASGTIGVQNAGIGSAAWELESDGAPWLALSPTSGSLPGPAADPFPAVISADPGPARGARAPGPPAGGWSQPGPPPPPAPGARPESRPTHDFRLTLDPASAEGGVPVTVTVNAEGLSGWHEAQLTARIFDDPLELEYHFWINIFVLDARIHLFTDALPQRWTYGIAGYPDGRIMVASGPDLLGVDPETADWESVLNGLYLPDALPTGMTLAPDGALYAGGSWWSGIVLRIDPSLNVTQVFSGVWADDVSVAADGTVFIAGFSQGLHRIPPGGTVETIYGSMTTTVQFNPHDGLIYFGDGAGTLQRIDPASLEVETVQPLDSYLTAIEVGQSGMLYVAGWNHAVWTIDPASNEILDVFSPPGAFGLALHHDWLYVTTDWGAVYRIAVTDHAIGVEPAHGVAIETTGDPITHRDSKPVDIVVDRGNSTRRVGSADGLLVLDPLAVRIDSIRSINPTALVTINADEFMDVGEVRWAVADPTPPDAQTMTMVRLWISAVTENGAPSSVTLAVNDLTDEMGLSLVPSLGSTPTVPLVNAAGIWGDVDHSWRREPAQPPVSARDALICMSVIVERDMSRYDTAACDVVPDGDGGTFTGAIMASDVLHILRKVVGMDVAGSRVGQQR